MRDGRGGRDKRPRVTWEVKSNLEGQELSIMYKGVSCLIRKMSFTFLYKLFPM
jgi:hypothetical protein